jgi:hypothetical protein
MRSQEKLIDGARYQVTQLPYSRGMPLGLKLAKVVGPAIAEGLKNLEIPSDASVRDLENLKIEKILPHLSAAVATLLERLDQETLSNLTDTLAEYTQIVSEGKSISLKDDMEIRFAGNYGTYLKWLGFALKVNFAGFLPELADGGLSDLLKKTA